MAHVFLCLESFRGRNRVLLPFVSLRGICCYHSVCLLSAILKRVFLFISSMDFKRALTGLDCFRLNISFSSRIIITTSVFLLFPFQVADWNVGAAGPPPDL